MTCVSEFGDFEFETYVYRYSTCTYGKETPIDVALICCASPDDNEDDKIIHRLHATRV